MIRAMPGRARRASQAAAEAASLDEARAAAGGGTGERGAGSSDPLIGDLRRAGLLPLLVLHFLAREESYGNQLIEHIAGLTGGALAVNPNTMYPLLRALEAQGLIAGEWEHPERRSRRFYRATPEGVAERERLAGQLAPRLDRISRSIRSIRQEVLRAPGAGGAWAERAGASTARTRGTIARARGTPAAAAVAVAARAAVVPSTTPLAGAARAAGAK